MSKSSGLTALVTGASSGIGAEFARLLAKDGANLIITARRKDRLDALAEELTTEHDADVTVIAADLSDNGGPEQLFNRIGELGKEVHVLVNNAGFGGWREFSKGELADEMDMLQVNVHALVELTHRFLPGMLASGRRCRVLNVGSVVGFMPVPFFANYCATKAYVRAFSESLAAELKNTNVSVTVLNPGGTKTEFTDVAKQKLSKSAEGTLMSARSVAAIGVRSMMNGRRSVVAGIFNKIVTFMSWLLPRRAIGAIVAKSIGKPAG